MSSVLDRSGNASAGSRPGTGGPLPPVVAGLLAAAQAAAASLVVVLVPTVLAWATASYSRAPWAQAARFGVDAWLLAHHTSIALAGGRVGLTPLGLLAIPVASCWFAGVRLARAVDPNAESIRDGVGRTRPAWPPRPALIALVGGYAALVALAGVLVTAPGARPAPALAFAGGLLVCGPAAACGAAAWVAGGFRAGLVTVVRRLRLPPEVTRCLRPAALAVAVLACAALLLFLLALLAGWSQVLALHRALEPGLAGGMVLVAAQLTLVPNLVVWTGSFAAGPGFAVGVGSSVTPAGTHLGAVPAVPVLGALPSPGSGPPWLWAVLGLPVLAGALAGWWIGRSRPAAAARSVLADAATTAGLAGAGWAVLAWLSAGPAGPGRLAQVGASAPLAGAAVALEVGLGAVALLGVLLTARYLSGRR